MAESFPEKLNWCWNEHVCKEVVSSALSSPTNWTVFLLDTVLYKNITLSFIIFKTIVFIMNCFFNVVLTIKQYKMSTENLAYADTNIV